MTMVASAVDNNSCGGNIQRFMAIVVRMTMAAVAANDDNNKDGVGDGDKTRHNKNYNQPLHWKWTAVRDSMGDHAEDDNSGSGSNIRLRQH